MGGSVSRGMKQMKTDGNGNIQCVPRPQQPEPVARLPVRLEMALDHPPEEKEEQSLHAWNPDDRSLNIFVKENDPFTFHRCKDKVIKFFLIVTPVIPGIL